MKEVKIWFDRIIRSKTMMFNAIVAGLAALEGVFGMLQAFLPGNVYAYLTVLLTVGNAVIRVVFTTQPITDK